MTAEFAAVVPAIVFVLAASLGCMQVAGEQLRLQDAVADAARALGRGETASTAAEHLQRALPGATLEVHWRSEVVCALARGRSSAVGGLLGGLEVRAGSCALAGGR